MCFEDLKSPPAYAKLMHDWYGSPGYNVAIRSGVATHGSRLYAPWDSDHIAEYPLLEPVAGLAGAIVVHSQFMEDRVRSFFKGPVLRLFLPSDQKVTLTAEAQMKWREETLHRKECHFATFGHLGRSKCLDAIIQAFARSPWLVSMAKLKIAGRADPAYARELESLVRAHGLSDQVSFEYAVTDERLLTIKQDADVFLNLRHPNTEGASGSLVEMMNTGKPVIVYGSGCYADLPQGAALTIQHADGLEAITQAMESLGQNAEQRIAVGAAGQSVVRPHDSREYVRRLKGFVLDHRDVVSRRARMVAPVRDGFHKAAAVSEEDLAWQADLSRSRLMFLLLERDKDVLSPEPFLRWPPRDLLTLVSRVLLDAPKPQDLASDAARILDRIERWPFYQLICKLRRFEAICQKEDVAAQNLSSIAERVGSIDFWRLALMLQPNVMARMLYLGILGRGWTLGEPDQWTVKAQQGVPGVRLLCDFLASPEYLKSFSDSVMDEVRDWAEDQVATNRISVAHDRPTPEWEIGRLVRFGTIDAPSDPCLPEAWHPQEAAGRWSNGRIGQLHFRLGGQSSSEAGTLQLRVRVTGTESTGPRAIVAYCNRKKVARLEIEDDAQRIWDIPLSLEAVKTRKAEITLVASVAYSPASRGSSKDTRELGLLVIEGRLTDSMAKDTASTASSSTDELEPALPFRDSAAPSSSSTLVERAAANLGLKK
jgi:glycosyltransferase involved in cell wall biosynthesis